MNSWVWFWFWFYTHKWWNEQTINRIRWTKGSKSVFRFFFVSFCKANAYRNHSSKKNVFKKRTEWARTNQKRTFSKRSTHNIHLLNGKISLNLWNLNYLRYFHIKQKENSTLYIFFIWNKFKIDKQANHFTFHMNVWYAMRYICMSLVGLFIRSFVRSLLAEF